LKDSAIKLLEKLLTFYSPSGKENDISNYLLSEMARLKFNVWKDEVGNVIGEIGRDLHPIVMLCGHMDTVSGRIPVRFENGDLYGRGAVDAKASLAAMVMAASTFVDSSSKILVCGLVGEESNNRGVKHLIKKGSFADYAIFGEPSGVENVIIGYKGVVHLKITCTTERGHSASSWLFENAIEKACALWNELKVFHFPEEELGSRVYSITSCLVQVKGGGSYSFVPSTCEISIDLRVPPQLSCDYVITGIEDVISKFEIANPKTKVILEVEGSIDPFEGDKNSRLVRAFSKTIRKVRQKRTTLLRKTGTGDMNFFGKFANFPVVTYGPGNSHLDHSPNEHINIQEYLDSIEIYRGVIENLLSI